MLNKIFSVAVYLNFSDVTVKICCLLFLFRNTNSDIPSLPAVICIIIIFFGNCFIGNELKDESATIPNSIYCTKWYQCTVMEQKLLLKVLQEANRNVVITANGFLDVTLESWTIVREHFYAITLVSTIVYLNLIIFRLFVQLYPIVRCYSQYDNNQTF